MPTREEVARGATNSAEKSGKKRGSVNNGARLQAFAESRGKGSADWGACDPKWIRDVIVGVTKLGGAVTYGLSRDEGAYSLTLLLDSSRQTLWFNGDADLDAELEEVCAILETLE